jgi:hypothetical protein
MYLRCEMVPCSPLDTGGQSTRLPEDKAGLISCSKASTTMKAGVRWPANSSSLLDPNPLGHYGRQDQETKKVRTQEAQMVWQSNAAQQCA